MSYSHSQETGLSAILRKCYLCLRNVKINNAALQQFNFHVSGLLKRFLNAQHFVIEDYIATQNKNLVYCPLFEVHPGNLKYVFIYL